MTIFGRLKTWWQIQTGEEDTPFDDDTSAFFVSLLFHMVLLLVLGLLPRSSSDHRIRLTITTPVEDTVLEDLSLQDFSAADMPAEIGVDAAADLQLAMAAAPDLAELSQIPSPLEIEPVVDGAIRLQDDIQVATGLRLSDNLALRGTALEGVNTTSGALDRLTLEILRSLEERKTLVVWLFDQSGSMQQQRQEVNQRFDRIYEELGVIEAAGNPAFSRHEQKPLLTSVVAFGEHVNLLTPEPTDDLAEIKRAVAGIETDDSGIERTFSAAYMAADQYKRYRIRSPATGEPQRNVMIVIFTDESGDDLEGVEPTIDLCRRYGIRVYVVGAPAPFGLQETMMKWVDPDPRYDQTPGWGLVDQGPETFLPERIQLSFASRTAELDPIDSGFGPFGLTRLCYETGGIFFSLHPNRRFGHQISRREISVFASHLKHFFDPRLMRRYRPEYVSPRDYRRLLQANRAREALVTAAQKSQQLSIDEPELRFVRRSDARLASDLLEAQQQVAKLGPALMDLYATLSAGEQDRPLEPLPRWQAGYDLAIGQVLANLVRAQTYHELLVQAQRGMPFSNTRNNTWVLVPSTEFTLNERLSSLDEKARTYLQRVIAQHPETPWALLAQYELDTPVGWAWTEQFTDLTPRPSTGPGAGGAGGGRGRGDRDRSQRPKKRPVPKL